MSRSPRLDDVGFLAAGLTAEGEYFGAGPRKAACPLFVVRSHNMPRHSLSIGDLQRPCLALNICMCRLVRPPPLGHFRLISAVLIGIVPAIDLHIAKFLFRVSADPLKLRRAIDYVNRQAEAIYLIVDS